MFLFAWKKRLLYELQWFPLSGCHYGGFEAARHLTPAHKYYNTLTVLTMGVRKNRGPEPAEKLPTEKLACDFQWLMALKASPFLALIGLTMIFSLASIYSHIFM